MKKSLLIIIWSSLMQLDLAAQMKGGFEQYDYLGKQVQSAVVPVLHIESRQGWYAELRYNYEELNSFSAYAGKSFSGGTDLSWTITPMLGVVTGSFKGGSLALNLDMEYKKIFFSAQSQYTCAPENANKNFLYNWSELGYAISTHFFSGLTVQYTRQCGRDNIEPGLMAGIRFNNISFPCYLFSPGSEKKYFVVGLNYDFSFEKKK